MGSIGGPRQCFTPWLVSLLLLLSAAASAETYYVSPTGRDDAAGTATQPWATISRAAQTLRAGDTAIISGGIYRESIRIDEASGSADAPITYQAAAGATVVIDADGHTYG